MAGMAARASTARSAASNITFLNFFSFSLVFFGPGPDPDRTGEDPAHGSSSGTRLSLAPRALSAGRVIPLRDSVRFSCCAGLGLRRALGGISGRGDYPGRSRGASRAELGFGGSQEVRWSNPSRLSRTSPDAKTQIRSSGEKPPPPRPAWPPLLEKELPPSGGAMGEAGCGTPSEGLSGPVDPAEGDAGSSERSAADARLTSPSERRLANAASSKPSFSTMGGRGGPSTKVLGAPRTVFSTVSATPSSGSPGLDE